MESVRLEALHTLMVSASDGKSMSDLMGLTMVAIGLGCTWEQVDFAVKYGQSVIKLNLN